MSILSKKKTATISEPQRIIAGLEAELDPAIREDYDKIVASGMMWGLDKGRDGSRVPMMVQLREAKDPVRNCAIGSVNMVFRFLAGMSKGRLPPVAGVWASKTLMYLALDFAERANILEVGPEEITKAEKLWSNAIFTTFRITPQGFNRAGEQVKGILNDPGKMEMLNLQTGYLKDPRAAQPTETIAPAPPMNRRQRRAAQRAAGRR